MAESERFSELIPRFLGALRALTRRGLLSSTSESTDLLHDFYLDAWPGVLERYAPETGPFDRYAIASLARFARSRAVRDAALRARLALHASEFERDERGELGDIDEKRIAEAVQRLPAERQALLVLAFRDNLSDREIARQQNLSRYVVRLRLAEALAAIAAEIDDRAMVSSNEARLARALFVDGEMVEVAAADLGLSLSQARFIRRALLLRFARLAGETRS